MLNPKEYPLCKDIICQINSHFSNNGWITLYRKDMFAILADDNLIRSSLENDAWELNASMFRPEFQYDNGTEASGYRPIPIRGIYPIVYIQEPICYCGEVVSMVDEFVLFYDLRRIHRTDGSWEYVKFDDNGDEITIAKSYDGEIIVREDYVLEYASVKDYNLILQFEFVVNDNKTLKELGLEPVMNKMFRENDCIFTYCLLNGPLDNKAYAIVRGKCVMRHSINNVRHLWDIHDYKKEEFIVGIDISGTPILSTCDEKCLPNIGNWDGNGPWQLSQVFFKETVLDKYYADTRRFNVMDGAICGPGWFAHLDSDHNDGYVIMALKDLGRLPNKEQIHWKKYNVVPPKGVSISRTTFSRWFMGNACNPTEAPALVFKREYQALNQVWMKRYGFMLFKPLAPGDQHNFDALHTMSDTDNDREFDTLIASIVKSVIDSLDESNLVKQTDDTSQYVLEFLASCKVATLNDLKGGIYKLKAFLIARGFDSEPVFEPLQKLQALRSTTTSHRKTTHPKNSDLKLFEYFGIGDYPQKDVMNSIYRRYSKMFEIIRSYVE